MKRASEKADLGKRRVESESSDRCLQDSSQIASFCPREGLSREDCRLVPAVWEILREEFAMGNPRRSRCAEPPHSEGAVAWGLAAREAMGCFWFGDWAGLRYALPLRKGALVASAEGLAHVAAAWNALRRAKWARQAGRFVSQFARRSASSARCDVRRKARSQDKARRRVG